MPLGARSFPHGNADRARSPCARRPVSARNSPFFLTDADLMTNSDIAAFLRRGRQTRIQAIEFGRERWKVRISFAEKAAATSTKAVATAISMSPVFPRR